MFPSRSLLDGFNRADGAPGSNWAAGFGEASPGVISANTLIGVGADSGPYWTPGRFGADSESWFTLVTPPSAGQLVRLMSRANGGTVDTPPTVDGNTYWLEIGNTYWALQKYIGGNISTLGFASVTHASGDRYGLAWENHNWSVYRNTLLTNAWELAASGSDASLPYGWVGFVFIGTSAAVDDFGGGDSPTSRDVPLPIAGGSASW